MKSGALILVLSYFAAVSTAQPPTTPSPTESSVYPGFPTCAVYAPDLPVTTRYDRIELIMYD